ncbi:MAG: class I SAM-dependent methyltransferase, partial [Nocardioidaceae bacterium]
MYRSTGKRFGRYTVGARAYDVLSLERPVYRSGRVRGIAALGLKAGDRVLDMGCGTGLSFPLLSAAVGEPGQVVGVDASPQMVERADARVRRGGLSNVSLLVADAAESARWGGALPDQLDAALFAYSLSIVDRWEDVWGEVLA